MKKDKEKTDETTKEYTFVRETIKKRPPIWVMAVIKILKFLGLGIVFGLGVCLVLYIFFNKNVYEIITGYEDEKKTEYETEAETEDSTKEQTQNKEQPADLEGAIGRGIAQVTAKVQSGDKPLMKDYTAVIVSKRSDVFLCISADKIADADEIYVTFFNSDRQIEADIFGVNENNNIAIIRVSASDIGEVIFGEIEKLEIADISDMKTGDKLVYIGNPYEKGRLYFTGALAGIRYDNTNYDTYYRIAISDILNSSVNDGFLFNEYGEIVAMVTSENNDYMDMDNISGICIYDMERAVNALVLKTPIKYMGIRGEAVTDEMRKLTEEDIPGGMYVTAVEWESPAYTAGIMVGDVIIYAGDYKVSDMADIQKALDNVTINDTITIVVKRKIGNSYKQLKVKVPVINYNDRDVD